MMIQREGGYDGGPLDFLCILRSVRTGRYHPCFVEEKPMPGPVPPVEATQFVRCKSKMHHTGGYAALAEAQRDIESGLGGRLNLPPENRSTVPINWDNEQMAFVVVLPNWVAQKIPLAEVLAPEALGLVVADAGVT